MERKQFMQAVGEALRKAHESSVEWNIKNGKENEPPNIYYMTGFMASHLEKFLEEQGIELEGEY